jgi:uncharacterized membrane protein
MGFRRQRQAAEATARSRVAAMAGGWTAGQEAPVRMARRRRRNLGPVERWLSVAGGGTLAAYGLLRRATPGGLAAVAGATLLYRGLTGHCTLYRALGVNHCATTDDLPADRHSDTRQHLGGEAYGIHVDESILIGRPAAEVYRFWRNLENLPRFMRHLESVAVREKGISHWVAVGPAGTRVSWDARIINDVEHALIGWQSLEGSTIATAGSVHFDESRPGTRLRVRLQYNPPAGRLGAAVAAIFGREPGQTIREDLKRLKTILEGGRA